MAAARVSLRDWWVVLGKQPEPLDSRQRRVFAIVALLAAATRLLAVSRTLWDWDEALFTIAMRDFDVVHHHPHPPGFPLFIATAKLFQCAGFSDFRALQAVSVVAAIALFPIMFLFARELRLPFATSVIAASLLVFFPNVWFFGGTAFSDVSSLALVLLASALLLRGCRDPRAFFAGAVLLGVSAGYRPQNILIGGVPFAIAAFWQSLRGRWSRAAGALCITIVIIAASYGFAARLSGGWGQYRDAVKVHEEYIRSADSFTSPIRPPLWRLFLRFFIRPYKSPYQILTLSIALLAAISLARLVVRRDAALAVMLAIFLPLAILSWLVLDWISSSRFSIAYAPMIAILVADGIMVVPARSARAIAAVLLLLSIVQMWPVLREVRTTDSPPVAAAAWIRANVPRQSEILVQPGMIPLAEALLPEYQRITAREPRAGHVYLHEGVAGDHVFRRDREHLLRIVRPRYFEISVAGAR